MSVPMDIRADLRYGLGDPRLPQGGDARARPHLRHGGAPLGVRRRRLRTDHERRHPPRHRGPRLLHARRALGVRVPHRRPRRDGPRSRGDLPRRNRLRHQLRDAALPHEPDVRGGPAAPAEPRGPDRRARSRRRGRRGDRPALPGRIPPGRGTGGPVGGEARVRMEGGPRAHRGRRMPFRRRRLAGEREGGRPGVPADRHPGVGEPLPGDPGRQGRKRVRPGNREGLRHRPPRPGGRHVPLRQPGVRPPGGDRLPPDLPRGDAREVPASMSPTGSWRAPRSAPRRGRTTSPR